jgi:putative hydrolase of the HAD superfamily
MRFAELDAVTVDAFGTLVELVDPVPALQQALREHGVERSPELVLAGFRAEVAYYGPRSSEGRDDDTLERLRRECARVFLEATGSDLAPEEFSPVYAGALEFRVLEGVPARLRALRARGLELGVVANWDVSLHERLEELGLAPFFSVIVAAAGKPSPDGLLRALDRLGVEPARALHVGDEPSDEEAARAAGMRFSPAPL